MVLTTKDFLSGAPFAQSFTWSSVNMGYVNASSLQESRVDYNSIIMGPEIDYNVVSWMQHNAANLKRLSNTECAEAYDSDLISDLRNVLLVTNASENNSILNIFTHGVQNSPVMPWFCGNVLTSNPSYPLQHVSDRDWPMNYSAILQEAANLQVTTQFQKGQDLNESEITEVSQTLGIEPSTNETCFINPFWNESSQLIPGGDFSIDNDSNISMTCIFENGQGPKNNFSGLQGYTFPIENPTFAYVQYCLAQETDEQCKVLFSPVVMSVVILCNILKTASFTILLLLPDFTPIGASMMKSSIIVTTFRISSLCPFEHSHHAPSTAVWY